MEDTTGFEFGGGENVKKQAKALNDTKLLRRIDNQDLFACEAKYHRSCRHNYLNQNNKYWRSKNEGMLAYIGRAHKQQFVTYIIIYTGYQFTDR